MMGDIIVNRDDEEVGMVIHRIVPKYMGTDYNGNPEYKMVLSEQVMLFRYPQLVFDFCEN